VADARRKVAFGLSALALATVAAPRLVAWRIRRGEDDDAFVDSVASERLTLQSRDEGAISALRVGSGPPIVLSHGVTLSVRTWVKQLESLPAAGFEAVAYDHRGHGASDLGTEGHAVVHLGHDLRAVLEQLDLHDVVIVGHSMGGLAVLSLLLDHPEVAAERVRGAVLLSTLPRVPLGSYATRMKDRYERITDRAPNSTWIWRWPDLGFTVARLGFGDDPKPSHVELVRNMLLECPPSTRLAAPKSLVGIDFADRLSEVDLPVLVVCGTRDIVTPLAHSELLAEQIRGARLEVLEGGGHMLMLERAETLDRLVIDFARSLPLRAAEASATAATS
jgi:3-oxoadipate enol-lactonase